MIDRDLWLGAIVEADGAVDAPDALSVMEFAATFGFKKASAQQLLAKLVELGRATTVRKRIRKSNGATQIVGAYRLLTPEGRQCVTRHAKPKPSTGRRSATTPQNLTMKTSAHEA